jgi:hypothetical protein
MILDPVIEDDEGRLSKSYVSCSELCSADCSFYT